MTNVHCLSLNVNGLNIPEKHTTVLLELWRMRTQVAFIQEIHFQSGKIPKFQNDRYPHIFHSIAPDSKKRVVCILLSGTKPWSFVDQRSDQEGRYLFLKGDLAGHWVTLASIYLPNHAQLSHLDEILNTLQGFMEGGVILGGDLNVALDPLLDASQCSSHLSYSYLE